MNTCRGHSTQVAAGKLISLMFLNAFCWLLPWGQAELRTQLVATAGARWRARVISPELALKDQTPHKLSCPSPALKIGASPARLYQKKVTVRFPVLEQNSLTLVEELHHHLSSSAPNETTSSKLAQFLPPDRRAPQGRILHPQTPTTEDKGQSHSGPVLSSSSSSLATSARCWAGAKELCQGLQQRTSQPST